MKYCPKCNTRYDEEIIRFCTKDGTPLVPEEEPNFVALPSENLPGAEEDEPGEVTVVRSNVPTPLPPLDDDLNFQEPSSPPPQRIVVSTDDEINFPPRHQRQSYQAPPKKANTLLVVLLTVIGTVIVLGGGLGIVYLLQRGSASHSNANVNSNLPNANVELNTNLGIDSNFNFNTNTNVNANVNVNANLKTPTPTPKPSPSPSPSPTPEEETSPTPSVDVRPATSPTPGFSPTTRPGTPTPSNRVVNGGVLNGRAISLTTPSYPSAAKVMHASGQVMVEISVDEAGRVTSAHAISGHPLLRSSAESAARQSRINPVRIDNENVKTTGVLIYNFREN